MKFLRSRPKGMTSLLIGSLFNGQHAVTDQPNYAGHRKPLWGQVLYAEAGALADYKKIERI